jgi:hypothetical protein
MSAHLTDADYAYLNSDAVKAEARVHGTRGYWERMAASYWDAPSLDAIKAVAQMLLDKKAACVWHAVAMYQNNLDNCMCTPCHKARPVFSR